MTKGIRSPAFKILLESPKLDIENINVILYFNEVFPNGLSERDKLIMFDPTKFKTKTLF